MYEFLDVGSNKTSQSPSHACPFAIVSFSYGDTKATPSEPQEKRYCNNTDAVTCFIVSAIEVNNNLLVLLLHVPECTTTVCTSA